MKNLKGCIHDQKKHRFHRLNLHQRIEGLNTLIHPALTVVDATSCALHWELGGDPIKLDTIIMSENVLAVDMIAASLLGYGIDEVRHLKIASESGLNPTNMGEIKVYNSPDTETRKMVVNTSQKKDRNINYEI